MAKILTRSRVGLIAISLMLTLPATSLEGSRADDQWQPEQVQITDLALVFSRATRADQVTVDRYGRRSPINPSQMTFFLACERAEQLDCIESFGVIEPSGTYRPGEFKRASTEMYQPPSGARYAFHSTFWDIPALEINGVPVEIRLDGHMGNQEASPGLEGMQMGLEIVPKTARSSASPDDLYGCIPGLSAGDYCGGPVVFAEDLTLRLTFRTSWISPAIVRARMRDANLEFEDLGKGALRWTLTGKAMLGQSFTLNPVGKERPAWVATSFDFYVWDPRIFSELNSDCYVNGPLLYSFNGTTGGQPNWNPKTGTLDINIGSLHYWPDGKTIWRGYYQTSIPEATARCLWGIDPALTSSLTLEVYDENGQTKAATTSITFRSGNVNIFGYDFSYSTTRLSVKVKAKRSEPCFSRGAQLRNLICTETRVKSKKAGKSVKKLLWAPRKR